MSGDDTSRIEAPEDIPPWTDLDLAINEDKKWPNEDALRDVKIKNDIRWHKVYGYVVPFLMILFVFIFTTALLVLSWHYFTPINFLTDEKLSKIQSVIFSGTIGAIVTGVLQKQIDKIK